MSEGSFKLSYFKHLDMPAGARDKVKWENRLISLMESYYKYCMAIGADNQEASEINMEKYNRFVEQLKDSMISASCKALLPK